MAIDVANEIVVRYSNRLASSGNADAADPTTAANASTRALGKFCSTAAPGDNVLHDVIPAFTNAECTAGVVKYRSLFLANLNTDESWSGVVEWLLQTAGLTSVKFALDPTGVTALGSASPQALETTSETTRPAGLAAGDFVSVADRASAVPSGGFTLGPLQCRAFWLEFTVAAGTGSGSDDCTPTWEGTG